MAANTRFARCGSCMFHAFLPVDAPPETVAHCDRCTRRALVAPIIAGAATLMELGDHPGRRVFASIGRDILDAVAVIWIAGAIERRDTQRRHSRDLIDEQREGREAFRQGLAEGRASAEREGGW